MNRQILILLIFVPTMLFAQKTKKVTDELTNEVFYVLKSDKKIRHGEYKMLDFKGKLLVSGYYKYGVKDSIWEYYNGKEQLIAKYDYTKDELIFCKPNLQKDKKYKIIVNENRLDTTLSRPPIFLGGDGLISSKVIYPISAMQNGKSGRVVVSFTVDKFGKTSNYHVNTPLGYGLDEEVIRVLKSLSDFWLPGLLDGQPVDVETEYSFNFKFAGVF